MHGGRSTEGRTVFSRPWNCSDCLPCSLSAPVAAAAKVIEAYPLLAETHAIDVIFPKKESAIVAKW